MKKFFAALLLGVFFASCSYYYTFLPFPNDTQTIDDKSVAYFKDTLYESSVNFENFSDNLLCFFVYFYNSSDENVLIDPGDIEIYYYRDIYDFKYSPPYRGLYFLDPELQVNNSDNILAKIDTLITTYNYYNFRDFFISSVKIVNNPDLSDNPDLIITPVKKWLETLLKINLQIDHFNNGINDFTKFWESGVLRKKLLKPGEEAGGLIFAVNDYDANFIRFFIPIGSKDHMYEFQLKRLKQ